MKFYYVIAVIFSGFLPFHSVAMINYISLHDIELNTHKALSIKLNIVEEDNKSQLKFILQQQEKKSQLSYQRLNKYMLRLSGNKAVQGQADIIVYQKIDNTWQKVNIINLNATFPIDNKDIAQQFIARSQNKQVSSIKNRTITSSSALISNKTCTLTSLPKETLWSIAKRYSQQWNLDVYSTMIAIFTQNKNQFSKQHIKLLKIDAVLTCPDKIIMDTLGSKKLMKEEFERLHNAFIQ
jgi:hypothetical protein